VPGIDELSGRAGYRPGEGYVHECEAADEILDESLEPFLADLDRGVRLGLRPAAIWHGNVLPTAELLDVAPGRASMLSGS
jgi:hypothetical protein